MKNIRSRFTFNEVIDVVGEFNGLDQVVLKNGERLTINADSICWHPPECESWGDCDHGPRDVIVRSDLQRAVVCCDRQKRAVNPSPLHSDDCPKQIRAAVPGPTAECFDCDVLLPESVMVKDADWYLCKKCSDRNAERIRREEAGLPPIPHRHSCIDGCGRFHCIDPGCRNRHPIPCPKCRDARRKKADAVLNRKRICGNCGQYLNGADCMNECKKRGVGGVDYDEPLFPKDGLKCRKCEKTLNADEVQFVGEFLYCAEHKPCCPTAAVHGFILHDSECKKPPEEDAFCQCGKCPECLDIAARNGPAKGE